MMRSKQTKLTMSSQVFNVKYLSVLYFKTCDLRVKALIQKSILVFYAIRRIDMLLSGSSTGTKKDAKAALIKLEVYLDTLVNHLGIRKERNFILDWCKDTLILWGVRYK